MSPLRAPSGGLNLESGLMSAASAACNRTMSSRSAIGSLLTWSSTAALMVGSSSQCIPRLDRRPIVHVNRTHHAGLGRLDHLGSTIHDDLPGCGCDNVD